MRHHSPGFQWMSCAPMLKEGIFENMRRICENAFRIPESLRKFRTDIVIDFFMGRRRALFRSVTKICRHRQWIKINKHALERIFGSELVSRGSDANERGCVGLQSPGPRAYRPCFVSFVAQVVVVTWCRCPGAKSVLGYLRIE